MSSNTIATLFVVGGALELIGLGLVAWDVRDAHLNVTRRLTPDRMKELLGGQMANEFTLTVAAATLVAGDVRRRALGVGVFALGVLVQTIGNLAGNGTI